ncbi:peptidase E [Glaciihabitans arcticus]|uniref:Peptidase E n=1 Tax=Glaciihabitans arcticus TaxID=2668039 RepID=A0A4Q9GT93_9MICO|nr:Type 1 glutamine amidotransferase-like domain-containing protein [Glaciihabitans arcticus]TBN57931.1 peptidase E [Glaciihabitans arcticus]
MRMLLTSSGLQNELVRETFLGLLDRPPAESSIAVIIDAILPFDGDNSSTLEHLTQLHSLGWEQFDLMSLFGGPRAVIEERLRSADVIFCYGGTNHWLAHAWTASGLAPLLQELLEEKVYLGTSAGSMIFSRRHADMVEAFDDRDEVEMLQLHSVAPALPLFDWSVMAHLDAPYFPDQTDETLSAGAARLAGPLYVIDDDTALLVRDAAQPPEIISTGRWLEFDRDGRRI